MLVQACFVRRFPTLSDEYQKTSSGVESDDVTSGTCPWSHLGYGGCKWDGDLGTGALGLAFFSGRGRGKREHGDVRSETNKNMHIDEFFEEIKTCFLSFPLRLPSPFF